MRFKLIPLFNGACFLVFDHVERKYSSSVPSSYSLLEARQLVDRMNQIWRNQLANYQAKKRIAA